MNNTTSNFSIDQNKTLAVLYQFNDAYAAVAATSIASLCKNNKTIKFDVHILDNNLSAINFKKINELAHRFENLKINFHNAQKYVDQLVNLHVNSHLGHIITWQKLLALDDIFFKVQDREIPDKILYINPHILCDGNINELIEMDMGRGILANCLDYSAFPVKQILNLKNYYNAGLMLINYKLWYEKNLTDFIIDNLKKHSSWFTVDQSFLNYIFQNHIIELPLKYNFWDFFYKYPVEKLRFINKIFPYITDYYSFAEIEETYNNPTFIYLHEQTPCKTWEKPGGKKAPCYKLFKKYLDLTTYTENDLPIAKKSNKVVIIARSLPLSIRNTILRLQIFNRKLHLESEKQNFLQKIENVKIYHD